VWGVARCCLPNRSTLNTKTGYDDDDIIMFSYSVLMLLVGRQEGHLACKKPGVGLLVVTMWLELCTSCRFSCHHHYPYLSSFNEIQMETFWYQLPGLSWKMAIRWVSSYYYHCPIRDFLNNFTSQLLWSTPDRLGFLKDSRNTTFLSFWGA